MQQLNIRVGKKDILLEVDDDATDDEIQDALQKMFRKAPVEPVKFNPARLEVGEMKVTIPDVNHNSTVKIELPDAKIIAKSVLQSQVSNAETVASLQSMVSEVLSSKIEFPPPCGWDCTLVRDDNGNLKKLRFEPI